MSIFHRPDVRALLGTDTDEAIAEQLGCTRGTVSKWRGRFQIPSYQQTRIDRVALHNALGTASDREIAERFGVSINLVWIARRNAGVTAWRWGVCR